jgi:membrane protease YdiL (CAAX protease family)
VSPSEPHEQTPPAATSTTSRTPSAVVIEPEDARARLHVALVVTLAVYGTFALTRVIAPAWIAGALLVAAFYLAPAVALRREPDVATRWQISEGLLPPWTASGWRTALVASLVVFPIFAIGFFGFYASVCAGEDLVIAPVRWLEAFTPWQGSLDRFLSRQCRAHPGGMWPTALRVPVEWQTWFGLGFLYWAALEVLVVALPEEVFHRGYLMSAFEERFPPRARVAGVPFGFAAVASSFVFALGHLVAEARTDRLFTFFPALAFAWLWRKSGSLWAPALFHAASNLLMQVLVASTFAR